MFLKILLIILFILFPLGQLERIPLVNPQIGLYFHDVVIVILVIYGLLKKLKNNPVIKSAEVFIAVATLSLVINAMTRTPQEILIAFLYLARFGLYFGLYIVCSQNGDFKKNFLTKLLLSAGSLSAIFGIGQYLFFPDIRPLTIYGWDPHYFRVVGTFLEPGFIGLICVLTIVLSLLTNSWLSLIISYICLALTYSRSSYLAFLAALSVLAYFRKSWQLLAGGIVVLLVTIIILPRPSGEGAKLERQFSIFSRIQNWQQAIEVIKAKPLLGVGFNFYRYEARDKGFLDPNRWQFSHSGAGIDNSFLFILATTGVFGLLTFIWLIYELIKKNLNNGLFIASLVAICMHSIFNNSLFFAPVMIWLWVLAAL